MTDAPRQIAVVTDYDGLVAACRARADALNVSRATIATMKENKCR
jgi:post-segregation antitoxin (ccd killing protein)